MLATSPAKPPSPAAMHWVRHDAAAGFSVRVPAGWSVQARDWAEIAISAPGGAAAALVRTRQVGAEADLALWLQLEYPNTEPGLHNVRMLEAEACGRQLARAVFDYGSQVFQGRASAVAVRDAGLVALFIAAAARAEFAQHRGVLTQILESLRFGPGPGRLFHHRYRQASAAWCGRRASSSGARIS